MIKINVISDNISSPSFIKNPNNYIDRKIKKLNIKNKRFKKNIIFCTLLLSGDKAIKKLNMKFRKKNNTTDVLSFPFYTLKDLKKKLKIEKEIYLGDIIVNLNKINEKDGVQSYKFQFDKLWVHGLVHLFGHDHKKEKDYKKMLKIEKDYLKYIK
jgi:probable rRNA maturation factor